MTACQWQPKPSFPCGRPATARWVYFGGASLLVCTDHDTEMSARLASPYCDLDGHRRGEKGCPAAELVHLRRGIVREELP